MREFLADPNWRKKAGIMLAHTERDPSVVDDLAAVTLHARIGRPEKVVCIDLNYEEHVDESGDDTPDNPVIFSKFPSSVTSLGDPDQVGPTADLRGRL